MTNWDLEPNVYTKESWLENIHWDSLVDIDGNKLTIIGEEVPWETERTQN